MFDDSDPRHELWGMGEEEEEEEEDATGAPTAQAEGPSLAGRGLAWRSLGAGAGSSPAPLLWMATFRPAGGLGSYGGPQARQPWVGEALPWGAGPPSRACGTEAVCSWIWPHPEATWCSSRTLWHPSFQSFYSAFSGHCSQPPPPEGPASSLAPEPKTEPQPFLDRSSCFYTDPAMPPGHRIYNWLSCSSLEVLHRLRLDTPAPIVAIRESPPAPAPGTGTRRQWLSGRELQAVSALLELSEAQADSRLTAGPSRGALESLQGRP